MVNIATQLDNSYRIAVCHHNDEVSKNCHILGRLINCVKFCGLFELALRGKDESEGSSYTGIFYGLFHLVALLFKERLKTATVFMLHTVITSDDLFVTRFNLYVHITPMFSITLTCK